MRQNVHDFLFGQALIQGNDIDLNFLALNGIRNADGRRLLNLGMGGQQIVDFLGIDVFTAADHHVLDPVHDKDIAVFVLVAHISGVQKSVDDRLLGLPGPVEIAFHDGIATDNDFTCLMGRTFFAGFINDFDDLARKGQADGADFADTFPRVQGGDAGCLGEAVSFHYRNIEDFLKPVEGFRGERGCAADPELQGAQVKFLSAGIRQQDLINGRNRRPEIDLVAVHHFPEFAGAEGFAKNESSDRCARLKVQVSMALT